MNALSRFQPVLLSILRIVTAYMFMLHGSTKLFQLPYIEKFAGVELFSLYGFAGILEFFGGILLILGLFTRPVAFILSGQMAVAYFMAHTSPNPLFPLMTGGEGAALFSFIFIYIASAGGGAWALDNKLGKK
ncbi:DoxX family protein [Neisseria perflava]|uniref:DoxX family protein n=1 Tax=Neisseria perflava TaxID=33053 RepID=UPI0020A1080F|nr:DoxX family protein [Neisseria perflava]MCP1660981.1 putative oxidoreductase [Neisseria perflava]MCP1772990.1 putative oxidoreductase [Neisseria perflava]